MTSIGSRFDAGPYRRRFQCLLPNSQANRSEIATPP
jgi:hypothetical protein